jgi:hypothetical protein
MESGSRPDPPPPAPSRQRAASRRAGRRLAFETAFQRLVATIGVIGVGVAIAAILASQNVEGWIVGLVVSIESVVLTGLLWSPREP